MPSILPQELQTAGVELQAALRSLPAPLYLTQQPGTRIMENKSLEKPGLAGKLWN